MTDDVGFRRLLERVELLERMVRRQGVRMNNMLREGVVKKVDFEKGLAIVDAHGVETKPLPWFEQAGDVNEWTPLSVGQRVMLVSPDGDPGKAAIMRGGFTDDTPQPHNKGAEKRTTIGDCTVTQSGESLVVVIGGCTFTFNGAGFTQTGGRMEHDGRNVGTDHVHGGIVPGGANTAIPAN